MGKKTLAMILALVFICTSMFGFNVLSFGTQNTSIHVKIESGDSSIASVAVKLDGVAQPMTLQKVGGSSLYDGTDNGQYATGDVDDIIVTKTNGNVLVYTPAIYFAKTEGGGTVNYHIYAVNDETRMIPQFDLTKTPNPTTAYTGDVVTYTFEVANTQSTVLNNVTITDPMLGGNVGTIPSIAANSSASITKQYTTTNADFINGKVDNTATATVTATIEGEGGRSGTITVTDTASATYNVSGYTLTIIPNGQGQVDFSPLQQAGGANNGKYSKGTEVTLNPVPSQGWRFTGWQAMGGAVVGNKVTMNNNITIIANFVEETTPPTKYNLTVNTSGSGITTPAGVTSYDPGTDVPLSASPSEGWQFDGWLYGQLTTPTKEITKVTMNSDMVITAVFSQVYHTLTMITSGGGITDPAQGNHDYLHGTVVTLSAIADEGWEFDRWASGEGYDVPDPGTSTITMNSGKYVMAIFTQTPEPEMVTLTVTSSGLGTVDPPVGVHQYPEGTVVTVTAIAAPGWYFYGWDTEEIYTTPNSETDTVYMNTNRIVKAIFRESEVSPSPYTLTVTVVGQGSVEKHVDERAFLQVNPDVDSYWPGTEVHLRAVPASGWQFVGWSQDLSGTNPDQTIEMTSNKLVTATFTSPPPSSPPPSSPPPYSPPPSTPLPEKVKLNISVVGQGTVLPGAGDHEFYKGSYVMLNPQAADGWKFTGWQGDTVGSNNQIYMDGNKKVSAVFEEINKPTPPPSIEPTPSPTPPPVEIPEEEVPTSLPKTGGLPAGIVYGLGGLVTTAGLFIRRKFKK